MEPREEKRLIRYILLLLLVIGGMMYLNHLRKQIGASEYGEEPVSPTKEVIEMQFEYQMREPSEDAVVAW